MRLITLDRYTIDTIFTIDTADTADTVDTVDTALEITRGAFAPKNYPCIIKINNNYGRLFSSYLLNIS